MLDQLATQTPGPLVVAPFAPTITGSTTGFGAVTYNFQSGYAVKFGVAVFIQIYLEWVVATSGTPAGGLVVTGLPFPSINAGGGSWGSLCVNGSNIVLPSTRVILGGQIGPGTQVIGLAAYQGGQPAATVLADDNKATSVSRWLIINGWYMAPR